MYNLKDKLAAELFIVIVVQSSFELQSKLQMDVRLQIQCLCALHVAVLLCIHLFMAI